MGWALLVVLATHFGAHVVIGVSLARGASWRRGAIAFFVPPLAPFWAWRAGQRAAVYVWTSTLAAYALGVAVT